MVTKKKKEVLVVSRSVRINTPPIQVELQTNDGDETLEDLKKMAEAIIDRFCKEKNERN